MLELNGQLNREDYVDFNTWFFLKKRLAIYIVYVFAIVLAVPFIIRGAKPFDARLFLFYLAFCVPVVGLTFVGIIWFQLRSTGRSLSGNGSALRPFKLTVLEDGLKFETDNSNSFKNWNYILNAAENNRSFFLFIDKNMAHLIPKRIFENESDLAKFRSLLKQNVKDTRLKME